MTLSGRGVNRVESSAEKIFEKARNGKNRKNGRECWVEIPGQFANRNALVEVVGAGQKKVVAVYANSQDEQVAVSLNTGEIDNVEKLSLMILSEKDGALVKKVRVPKR